TSWASSRSRGRSAGTRASPRRPRGSAKMEVRALAKDQPVSPQKVRLVLDVIEGKPVEEALTLLEFMPQPSARMVWKVLKSAASNAENNFDLDPDGLRVKK